MQAPSASISDIADYLPLTVPVQPFSTAQASTVSNSTEISVNFSIEIKATTPQVWQALRKLAGWPEWFGANETIGPFYDGAYPHNNSPFTRLFDRLTPFQQANRAAALLYLVPGQSVGWRAQGREMLALHIWRLEALDSFTTRVSVEISFEGMSQWYFNVMSVAAKMQAVCQPLLEQLQTLTEND